jgi:3',5'-cyclic AMP phosphodiesterase CpdA
MKLYAISDLHLGSRVNREALGTIRPHLEDWLILAGDVGESLDHLGLAFETLTPLFAGLIWVPGNHELWTLRDDDLRGEEKYRSMVELSRSFGVFTPEDPFVLWQGEGGPCLLAPLFLLYDYSFVPDHIEPEDAVDWAVESGVLCADERYLHPDPFPSRAAWCEARSARAEIDLAEASKRYPLVIINHFPLKQSLAHLPRIPRFSIWCGTKRTEDWHRRFRARVVVSGHLHIRSTQWIEGVRFEEVSLGYPRQWRSRKSIDSYLREILPGAETPLGNQGPTYHW